MSEENKKVELNNEDLVKVSGGVLVCSHVAGADGRCFIVSLISEGDAQYYWNHEMTCQNCQFNEFINPKN